MVADLAAGLTAFKSAFDLAKGIAEISDVARRNTQAIELQTQILVAQQTTLTLQSQQSALLDDKRSLEEKIARLEAWDTEKKRYQLEDVGRGTLAYVIKEDARGSEPPHKICANCYQQGHKSILQQEITKVGQWPVLVCHRCNANIWPGGGSPRVRT